MDLPLKQLFAPRLPHLLVVLGLAASVAACAPDVQNRGNLPAESQVSTIQPGQSTRADVAAALGTPSTTSLFDNGESWFYIGGHSQQYAFYPITELDRQVLAISFDQQGVVTSVRKLTKEDGTDIQVIERTTPTAGNEITIMQQLLGNIGRFNRPIK